MRLQKVQRGFTLIELLVVVAILVSLAGLVLPKLDKVMLKENKGIAGNGAGGTSRYIQTYRILHNVYPDRWDSLTDGTNLQAPGAPGGNPGIDPQLTGGPPVGSPTKLTTTTIPADDTIRSLTRMGISQVLDWGGSGQPGDRFTVLRTLAPGSRIATINAADGDGAAIIDQIYPENRLAAIPTPGAIPPGNTLLVVGLGPLNTAIGDVLQETPFYPNTDPSQYYNRYLAIFEAHGSGSRAELKMVVGADADRISEEINDYYEK